MLKRHLLPVALAALVAVPAQAQIFLFGAGSGTSTNVGPVSNGGGTQTSGCAVTGGYQGYGDCLPSTVTVQRYFALRAFSFAAAQAGAYLGRIYGDGGTGDAGTGVYADVRAKADGTPDWANAVLSSGAVGSILPGAGTVTTNPCFGGDGKCRALLYDQSTQTTTASTSAALSSNSVANRPILVQNCQNNTFVTTIPAGNTRACLASTPNMSLQDTSVTAAAVQPYSLSYVGARQSGSAGGFGLVGLGTAYIGTGAVNTWRGASTTVSAFTVTDGTPANVEINFNGTSGLLQVNGSLVQTNFNSGNAQTGGTMYMMQQSAGGPLYGVSYEFAYATGTWDASHLTAEASNKSAYYSLGY